MTTDELRQLLSLRVAGVYKLRNFAKHCITELEARDREIQTWKDTVRDRRETVCEWQHCRSVTQDGFSMNAKLRLYRSANHPYIEIDEFQAGGWTFCPYCGGTIRITGQEENEA